MHPILDVDETVHATVLNLEEGNSWVYKGLIMQYSAKELINKLKLRTEHLI